MIVARMPPERARKLAGEFCERQAVWPRLSAKARLATLKRVTAIVLDCDALERDLVARGLLGTVRKLMGRALP